MKRATWILLIVFAALLGLFFYLDRKGGASQSDLESGTETAGAVSFIFTDQNGIPLGIEISDTDGNIVEIARNEEGTWMLKQPTESEADQGLAEAAASQVTALRILSTLELAPEDAGLVPPSYVMTVNFSSGESFGLEIGDLSPTQSGYYARITDSEIIQVVSKPGIDSLLNLLSDPPYPKPLTPDSGEPSYGN